MRSSFRQLIAVVVIVWVVSATANAAQRKCSGKADSPVLSLVMPQRASAACSAANVKPVVETMNAEALSNFSKASLGPRFLADEPMQDGYLKFIAAMGSHEKPSDSTICAMRQLTHLIKANPNRELAVRIWVNTEGTSYNENDARALSQALDASTIVMHWPLGHDTEAPVDAEMRSWLAHRKVPLRDPVSFVEALRRLKSPINSHPFNALVSFSQSGTFDSAEKQTVPGAVKVPYYESNGIQGIRLESTYSGSSLYIFTGSAEAITGLQKSLDVSLWNAIKQRFTPEAVFVSSILLDDDSQRGYRPGHFSYGTILWSGGAGAGVQESRLHVARGSMDFGSVVGIEGFDNSNAAIVDIGVRKTINHMFSITRPVLAVLVDNTTGAIFLVGARL